MFMFTYMFIFYKKMFVKSNKCLEIIIKKIKEKKFKSVSCNCMLYIKV